MPITLALGVLLLSLLAGPAGAADEKKLPVPAKAEQDAAAKLIGEVYADEYKNAETPEQKVALAGKLLDEALRTNDDPTGKFVLMRIARDVAAGGGDYDSLVRAVEQIDRSFEIDAFEMKSSAALKAAKARILTPQKKRLAEALQTLADEAVAEERTDVALRLIDEAVKLARAVRDRDLSVATLARQKEIERIERKREAIEAAMAILEKNPIDPEANLQAGSYHCFVRGDWETGVPMLALGSDEELKAIATKDLENPQAHLQQSELADMWHALADKATDDRKPYILDRAGYWYEKALPMLTGLTKKAVEKRLQDIADANAAEGAPTRRTKKSKGLKFPINGMITAASYYRFEVYVNGQPVLNGSGGLARAAGVFKGNDIVIARVRRSGTYRSFACVISFEDTKLHYATGAPGTWSSYQPNSTIQWYTPGQGRVVGPAVLTDGRSSPTDVAAAAGFPCGAIWSTYDENPTSSFSYSYLILQVK